MHLNYYHNVIDTGKCHQFIVNAVEELHSKDVGTAFIKNIDLENRKAEFGIFIGDDSGRGKGVGKLARKNGGVCVFYS